MSDRPTGDHFIRLLESMGADVPHNVGYGWRPIRCHLHDDRNASAQVNVDDGFWRCHACNVWGDIYALIMEREGVGFSDAKRIAAQVDGGGGSEVRNASGSGSALPGKAWHNRGHGTGGKTGGGGRYTGTYSR